MCKYSYHKNRRGPSKFMKVYVWLTTQGESCWFWNRHSKSGLFVKMLSILWKSLFLERVNKKLIVLEHLTGWHPRSYKWVGVGVLAVCAVYEFVSVQFDICLWYMESGLHCYWAPHQAPTLLRLSADTGFVSNCTGKGQVWSIHCSHCHGEGWLSSYACWSL